VVLPPLLLGLGIINRERKTTEDRTEKIGTETEMFGQQFGPGLQVTELFMVSSVFGLG